MKYVRLHLEEHISVRQIEKEYGIGNSLVSSWVKRYLEDGEEALEPHNGNPDAALHRSKSLTEVECLRLLVARQEVEIARLKKDIGWKELVQARSTLLAAERLRSPRRTQSKVSRGFSLRHYGNQSLRLLQMESEVRTQDRILLTQLLQEEHKLQPLLGYHLKNHGKQWDWTLLVDTFNNEIIAHSVSPTTGDNKPYYECLAKLNSLADKKEEQRHQVVFHTDQGAVYSSRAF